ncbi:MAG: riboflavin synthase [Gammaproteobacteria bacterium]|nr:riboflavin synthase [Gammaproteobacteria bacterium]|tara:strand:+ start:30304 stop:30891 length:588 start_codon:yes stop_codon:yes gene_type:complete
MFTGIVEEVCKITDIDNTNRGYKLHIEFPQFLNNLKIGDSISINGTCLTIENIIDSVYTFSLSPETLKITTLKNYKNNDFVNIETPLTINKFVSGHIVNGHIDCKAKLINIEKDINSWKIELKIDQNFTKYIIPKGCICIDGVSLTVNSINNNIFDVMIIPHTFSNTIIQYYKNDIEVNIEVDMLLKHLEKMKND